MSPNSLLVKGAINTSGAKPEVLKLQVSRHDPYQYDEDCAVFEILFKHGEELLLKIELVNLFDLCYLRDFVYSESRWDGKGLLMALSVAMRYTGFKEFLITGDYLFSQVNYLQDHSMAFKEIIFHEVTVKLKKAFLVKYIPNEILITHKYDDFSAGGEVSILDDGLNNGVELKYMCKSGICMKCRKKIISGACIEILPQADNGMIKEFHLLTCNSKALTSLIIG
jgi:ferredoxin